MLLKNKNILVTGGSRGIGRAISIMLANEGANLIINYSKSDSEAKNLLNSLNTECNQTHIAIKADIAIENDISNLMEEIKSSYKNLDVIVNNAGWTKFIDHSDLKSHDSSIFDDMYKVHFRGSYLCIKYAESLLRKSKQPNVINIASVASITAIGSNIAYCAMKAAVVNMTKSLARALAPEIRVNAISPGLVDTDLTKNWTDYRKSQIDLAPLKRLITPQDIANEVLHLTLSPCITGQNIILDGGRTLN
jgi:3-oxoacyl-[acyl-carrier protein] reductase